MNGFWIGISAPLSMSNGSWFCNASMKMLAMIIVYVSRSALTTSRVAVKFADC